MPTVELVYDADCPNVEAARECLGRALVAAGLPPVWQEWDQAAPDSPDYVRGYGSPTILVDGHDVADTPPSDDAPSCRIYTREGGQLEGVPPEEMITAALMNAAATVKPGHRQGSILAVMPAIGAVLLPGLTCPACWPAYAGLLGAFGLGFLDYTLYLLPLTTVCLIVAVGSLGYRAGNRRGYKPLVAGSVAAIVMVLGKFVVHSQSAVYAGIALLITASLWNAWSRRRENGERCPACAPAHQGGKSDEHQA